MHSSRMFEPAQQLADAKSNQDLTTAMRLLHPATARRRLLEEPNR
ncbi:hypothetical protein ACFXNW_20625 [Nocardia sp. NPDC059180]